MIDKETFRVAVSSRDPVYQTGNTMLIGAIVAAMVLLTPLSGSAGIFKCTDKRGKIIFSDRPCATDSIKKETYQNKETLKSRAGKSPVTQATPEKPAVKPQNRPSVRGTEIKPLSDLFKAVTADDVEEVKRILTADPGSVHDRDRQGRTTLHLAAQRANLEMVNVLLEHGADVNARTSHGQTPLFSVGMVGENHKKERYAAGGEIAVLLVNKGARVHISDKQGKSLLFHAAFYGNAHVARLVLDGGVPVDSRSKGGTTAMHEAAWTGHINILELLLEKGGDINAVNKQGQTPIFGSAWTNKVEVARFLLARGAKLKKSGRTPLHLAAQHGQIEISAFFLNEGVSVNANSDIGTPLHQAAWTGKHEYVAWILKQGAKTEAKNRYGNTPLHEAASWGKVEVTSTLLKHGANKRARNKQGQTPLEIAASRKRDNVVALLR